MSIKVFIVDDHYMVIEGIRSLLQPIQMIEWMGHATNGESCLAFLKLQQPDVILMDINMPGMSGIDLCAEVKNTYPAIHVLGLSTFNQQSFIKKMLDNGASGYVLKNATEMEIMEGIETVIKGKTYLSIEASHSLRHAGGETAPVLTRRELEVLEQIADGLTNPEIASKLFISVSTVDTHRKNLLAKFDCRNVASMVKRAAQLQLI